MNGYYDDRAWAPQMGTGAMGLSLKDVVKASRYRSAHPMGMPLQELCDDSIRTRGGQMGLSLEDIWGSAVKGLETGISNVGTSALTSVVQTASKDPGVQQQLQQSAASQAAQHVMQNKWLYIGLGVGALALMYLLAKK